MTWSLMTQVFLLECKSLLSTAEIQWSVLTLCMNDMHSFHFVRKDEGKDKNSKAAA